jgi:hypothetical protein
VGGLLVAALVPLTLAATAASSPLGARAAPTIRSVSPSTGDSLGGTVVTIKGRHLRDAKVRFGGLAPLRVVRAGPRAISVVAPPHAPGTVRVGVRAHGQKARPHTFTYAAPPAPAPHVTELVPAIGRPGDQVGIVGDGFTSASAVYFGTTRGAVLGWTPTRLTVQAPPHAAGPVDVQVVNLDGRSVASARSVFTYRLPSGCTRPVVGWIDPRQGDRAGGTRVGVHGGGFSDVVAVTFGGAPGGDVVVISPTELEVTTPPHASGVTDVQVETQCDLSTPGDYWSQFRLVPPPPTITSIVPHELTKTGGRVTITGTNFEEVDHVSFGDENGAGLVVVSPQELVVTAPPNPYVVEDGTTSTNVSVATSGGFSPASPGSTFTWVGPPPSTSTACTRRTAPPRAGRESWSRGRSSRVSAG